MTTNDNADGPEQKSHLFIVRLWPEDLGSGRTDWRGRVQHVNSGEARYFRDWPTLEAFIEAFLRQTRSDGSGLDDAEGTARR